jgi:hypothetical protein
VRVDHVDGVPMILVEPSATNLVTYSEDFSENYWGKQNVTVSAAPVAAPDGSMTATHVVKGTSEGHLVKSQIVTNGSDTISIWARTVSGSGTVFFNYHAGTPSTVTDEWQRFEVTANAAHVYAVNFRGSSTLNEVYIWGAQAEAGSVATSYIPTSGSTVTRAADDLVISGSDFSDFYNASEGTVYFETSINSSGASYPVMFHGGSSAHYLRINNDGQFRIKTAGSDQVSMVIGSIPANSLARAAVSYKENDFLGSVNGGSEVTDTSGLVPTVNQLQIGSYFNNTSHINGHIKRLIYWPYHSNSL